MKKKLIYALITGFVLLVSFDVRALCSNDELKTLKEKAKKVEFAQDYEIVEYEDYLSPVTKEAEYKITAYNLDSDLNVYASYYRSENDEVMLFKYNKNKTTTLKNFYSGRLKIIIEGNTKNCYGKSLDTRYIDLLYYNVFYDTEDCQEYPEFEYCRSEFIEDYVDNVIFHNKLNNYIAKLETLDDEDDDKEDEQNISAIITIIVIVIITIAIVSLGGYFVYKKIKTERKKRRL